MSKVLVLTSLYPAEDLPKEQTPVVHYFAREWVQSGTDVRVIHYPFNLPRPLFWIVKLFGNILSSWWGAVLRTEPATECEYLLEGVKVKRIPLIKLFPHKRYSTKEITVAFHKTISYCEGEGFIPDVIVSHWSNPQLQIMRMLKTHYHVPTVYVAHNAGREVLKAYGEEANELLNSVDLVGFRSSYIENNFRELFRYTRQSFPCYSGIPEKYLLKEDVKRDFSELNTFIMVGTLIRRKYPASIVAALKKSFNDQPFVLSFVGRGEEEKKIKETAERLGVKEHVHMLGFMNRDEVVEEMKKHEVFVMISRSETFGLVYLEAMSAGCITIASRKGGFDGIIKHGKNGFLCAAGDDDELAHLISEIRQLPREQLQKISEKAIATARELTDKKVARNYMNSLGQLIESHKSVSN